MRSYKEIENDAAIAIHNLILEAYHAGLRDGRREGEEFRASVAALLAAPISPSAPKTVLHQELNAEQMAADAARVSPGTVKPGIMNILAAAGGGMTTDQIIAATGFKPNSVRGTLSTLKSERLIDRVGDAWIKVGGGPWEKVLRTPDRAGNEKTDTNARGRSLREKLLGGLEDFAENEAPTGKEGAS
jgi:hypothetical protein